MYDPISEEVADFMAPNFYEFYNNIFRSCEIDPGMADVKCSVFARIQSWSLFNYIYSQKSLR